MRSALPVHPAADPRPGHAVGIPDAVLFSGRSLTRSEYEVVKRHAALGAEICTGVLSPEQVEWVRHHHERPDGKGYPDGLRGEMISAGAAILAVADAFDVMTTERPYSAARTLREALDECAALAGTQFAPEPVAALLAAYDAAPRARGARSAAG